MYHIDPKGNPGVCHAKISCPYGDLVDEHYETREDALEAYEQQMAFENFLRIDRDNVYGKFKKYVSPEKLSEFRKKIRLLSPLFENYVHDYSSYNPDDRPGERKFLENYDYQKYASKNFSETADNIILKINPKTDDLEILLIQRGGYPYTGCWAHPGGFVDKNESLEEAASRELFEETGIKLDPEMMTPVKRYDHLGRDPRMNVHMNTHLVLLTEEMKYSASDDAADAKFVPVNEVFDGKLDMAFDHKQSIRDALMVVLNS